MLSDEEKKAVEILKEFLEKLEEFDFDCQECGFNQQDEGKSLKILLNSIKKQSKEIEELKDIAETLRKENVSLYIERRQNENKIKAKIEEYKNKIKKLGTKS